MLTLDSDAKLQSILTRTELLVQPGEWLLIGFDPAERPRLEVDLPGLGGNFWQYIVEPDVLTLLLDRGDWARRLESRYPAVKVTGPLRLFTFSMTMDWDVVGFLAAVTGVLAQADVPLGAVCGYYRDHLFIAVEYAARAEAVLRAKLG